MWRGHSEGMVGGKNNVKIVFLIVWFESILINQQQQRQGGKEYLCNLRAGLIY